MKQDKKQHQTNESFVDFLTAIDNENQQYLENNQNMLQIQNNDISSFFISVDESSIMLQKTINPAMIQFKVNIVENKMIRLKSSNKNQNEQINRNNVPQITQKLRTIDVRQFFEKKRPWELLDRINKDDPTNQITYMLYKEILDAQNQIINELNQDEQKQKIFQQAKKKPESIFTILLVLEEYLNSFNKEVKVTFCQKSTLQSQVSMKLISTGFAFQKFQCSQKVSKQRILVEQYEDIINDYDFFIKCYKKYFKGKYGFQFTEEIISISKLSDDKIGVEWCTYNPQQILTNKKANSRIKVKPYFDKFYLSLQDFQPNKGYMVYGQGASFMAIRGQWPYYLPESCRRFGIKVGDKFDSGNNDWLSMDSIPGEWPSAFFGLCNPEQFKDFHKKDLNQINTKKSIAQIKRTLKTQKCVNKNQPVGQGILCTPYMKTALQDTFSAIVNAVEYSLVFQCRFNSQNAKVTSKQQYWIINQFSDIRPYGIFLFDKKSKEKYPEPKDTFQQLFSYEKFKQRIQKGIF